MSDTTYRHDAEGWWFLCPHGSGMWYGGYETKREAIEARSSFVRNWIGKFRQSQICTGSGR